VILILIQLMFVYTVKIHEDQLSPRNLRKLGSVLNTSEPYPMKRFLLISSLILWIGAFTSCDKNEYETLEELPGWLQKKITEIIPDQKTCSICDVTIIRYNGKIYFHLYCGFWSCVYCHFYDEKGNRPDWDQNTWNEFYAHHEVVKTLPACKGD